MTSCLLFFAGLFLIGITCCFLADLIVKFVKNEILGYYIYVITVIIVMAVVFALVDILIHK